MLSKILDFLLSPLTWVIIILCVGLVKKNAKVKKRLFTSSLIVILIFGNGFLVDEAMRAWEVPAIELKANESYDYGIVLSGMTIWDARFKRINFNGNVDRLLQVLPAHKHQNIKTLIISGGDGTVFQTQKKEAVLLKEYLNAIGYPVQNILIEKDSKNTFENAAFTAKLLKDSSKVDVAKAKILLVTSSIHMRRSIAIFNKQGFNCKAYVSNRISGPRKFEFEHLCLPKPYVFNAWHALLHEMIGYLAYLLMGYL